MQRVCIILEDIKTASYNAALKDSCLALNSIKRLVAGTTVPMIKNDAKLEIIANGSISLIAGIKSAAIANTAIDIVRPHALPHAIFKISDDDFKKWATVFFANLTKINASTA